MRFKIMGLMLCLVASLAIAAQPPALELVDIYPGNLDLNRYWVSEKYDGVRGYWDGKQFWTRQGHRIHTPKWFTQNFPNEALDGELWVGYGQFTQASSIIRSADADSPRWQDVQYLIFDLPDHGGDFNARVPAIKRIVKQINQPWVKAIKQYTVADETELYAELDKVVAKGGEGLVLHRGSAPYRAGRNVGLYKLKPYHDAEAKVLSYNPGRGRIQGLMGSINVRTPDGREFAIGTGFTDADRANPPPIGSWITYGYNGLTKNGLPRFARYLHPRPEGPPPEAPPLDSQP